MRSTAQSCSKLSSSPERRRGHPPDSQNLPRQGPPASVRYTGISSIRGPLAWGGLKANGAGSSDDAHSGMERGRIFALASEGNPRQGRMRRHRVITTAVLLALALPATADAGSLLSGYGGPGQGNQAILGATVIGGASGGSGGGSSSGGASGSGAESSTSSTPTLAVKPQGGGASHRSNKAKVRQGHASRSPGGAYRATSTLSANETASAGTPTLGISGTDLVYIVLAFGVLVLTAAITGRLVRRPH
jgi:hypothetical protein